MERYRHGVSDLVYFSDTLKRYSEDVAEAINTLCCTDTPNRRALRDVHFDLTVFRIIEIIMISK